MKRTIILFCIMCLALIGPDAMCESPLRLALGGISHGHSHQILSKLDRTDIQLVGIWETDENLIAETVKRYGIDRSLFYSDLGQMLDQTKPEALAGFGSIYDHLHLVEEAAPRGVHVMVEKPLAVSMTHARKMEALAKKHNIFLITNYETTWYPTNDKAYRMAIEENKLGPLRKIIVYDGHNGPAGIHVEDTFLRWLTDPKENGGGAVVDFGCYGANLLTWFLKGERPAKVYADIRQHDPETYPDVDDDATIIVSYKDMEGIINASWAWPFSRKDMHVYGKDGYIYADNKYQMRTCICKNGKKVMEGSETLTDLPKEYSDPFCYLKALIRSEIEPEPYDLSSLENNMIVVEILDAAKKSAKTGRTVRLR